VCVCEREEVRKALPARSATFLVSLLCLLFVRPLLCTAFRACSLSLSLSLFFSHTHIHERKTWTGSGFRASTMCVRESKLDACLCVRGRKRSYKLSALCVREEATLLCVRERGSYTTICTRGRKLQVQRAVCERGSYTTMRV